MAWRAIYFSSMGPPIGVVEAKKQGGTLTGVELQTTKYREGVLDAVASVIPERRNGMMLRAVLQLPVLLKCLRRPAGIMVCGLLLVPTAQNLPSSRPPQSQRARGVRLPSQQKAKRHGPLGTPQDIALPRSRQTVAHRTSSQTGASPQPQLFLDTSAPQYTIGDSPQAMAGGDFNGDGKPDLVAIYSSMVSVLLGDGDGTFQPHVDYATGSFPHSLVVGDFNRDGHADIVTSSLNYISVLLGNGDGTFQTHVDYAVCSGGGYLAVADFNGDGNLDLAFPNSCDNNSVTILLGKGDGTFQTPVNSPVGSGAGFIAIADFNNDG